MNLSNQKIEEESISEELFKKYIGGAGLATKYLYDKVPAKTKIIAEGARAASIAALLSKKIDPKNISNIVCMISGGNIDIDMLKEMLNEFNS